jgi:predicted RNase H-like nuclease (RuvC/YqgF family)
VIAGMEPATIIALITALGVGGTIQALVHYFKDRKRNASESVKTDVDTKLAYLNTVIERLDAEAKRSLAERDRLAGELSAEQQRSSDLRKRVRELEDELDDVRRLAREAEHKCDQMAIRLRQLVDESHGDGTDVSIA